MFNSIVLDVAIGVAFVFLLVSIVCSAIREAIEHVLKTRASYLEYAIRELLRDPRGTGVVKAFFDHPLIAALYPGSYTPRDTKRPSLWHRGKDLPSYIPARSFAMALLDMAARGPTTDRASGDPQFVTTSFDSVRRSVTSIQNTYVQRVLLVALDASNRDLEQARKNLEAWYDGSMDRVSGWYKRSTQAILFVIALLVTVLGNIDTIHIARTLYRDPALREVVVASVEKLPPKLDEVDGAKTLQALDLPIGWSQPSELAGVDELPALLRMHALGWLLTAFAATLGAPFWFDVLNRVMVIRSTVKPHEKSPEESSEDRQPRLGAAPQGGGQPPPPARDSGALADEEEDGCGEPIDDAPSGGVG